MFIIAAKRIKGKDGKVLKYPKWEYAYEQHGDLYFTDLSKATKFSSINSAEEWYHGRRRLFSAIRDSRLYEERSFSIREVQFKWKRNLY